MDDESDREELESLTRAILRSLKRTEAMLGEMRKWLRFFGVMTILGLLAAVIFGASLASPPY